MAKYPFVSRIRGLELEPEEQTIRLKRRPVLERQLAAAFEASSIEEKARRAQRSRFEGEGNRFDVALARAFAGVYRPGELRDNVTNGQMLNAVNMRHAAERRLASANAEQAALLHAALIEQP